MDSHPETTRTLGQGLAGYVRAVAAEVGVPTEGTGYEVSDTVTAYLGLSDRWAGRDLMLVWDERLGWYVGVETRPDETQLVLCYLGGDAVPTPGAVAQFVAETVAGSRNDRLRPVLPLVDRFTLAKRMAERMKS